LRVPWNPPDAMAKGAFQSLWTKELCAFDAQYHVADTGLWPQTM
jgi:hypothetical protein